MKLSQIKSALHAIVKANRAQPDPMRRLVPYITSAPGLGKSSVTAQVAAEEGIGFVDWRLSQMDPVDLRGLPVPRDGMTHYYPPAELPRKGEGILFLDELPQAAPSVMNAASQLILDKRIGDYVLPLGWQIVAAGNRRSDRANAHDLASHLKNRLVHMSAEADADETTAWGAANGMHPFVIGFLRYRKELVHKPNYDRPTFPSPRAWMFVSEILNMRVEDRVVEQMMISGAVDEGAGAEFYGYLSLFRELPDARDVFRDPKGVELPKGEKRPAILFALCSLLAREVTRETMDALVTFMDRITQDYAVATMKDIKARDVNLLKSQAYIRWVTKHHSVII